MDPVPLRLLPGVDLRTALEAELAARSVRTTAEVLLLPLPEWSFNREFDPATGFAELVISRRGAHADQT
jgi:predicted DNA-binding protein with PD1-like motif